MSLFDRISQLTDENALLRSQLHDAQEQAKRDTDTIGRQRETIEKLGALCCKRDGQLLQIHQELSTLADKCTL